MVKFRQSSFKITIKKEPIEDADQDKENKQHFIETKKQCIKTEKLHETTPKENFKIKQESITDLFARNCFVNLIDLKANSSFNVSKLEVVSPKSIF